MLNGWMYLVAILDWYSRYVVSWELDQTLELPFVLTALQRALTQTVPLICNSDQGSHFTSPQYCQLLLAAKVQISMDGKGRALDNIFTERLWRTVKRVPKHSPYPHNHCRRLRRDSHCHGSQTSLVWADLSPHCHDLLAAN